MKKLLLFLSIAPILLFCLNGKAQVKPTIVDDKITSLYNYLGSNIKYPKKAIIEDLQGNSVILFSIANGKIKDIQIKNQLGSNFDGEVINNLLSFTGYDNLKKGKYALHTKFRLQESSSVIKNDLIKVPNGYKELDITIIAFKPENISATTRTTDQRISFNNRSGLDIKGSDNSQSLKSPLYILDGKELEDLEIKDLQPNTIQSISILKDNNAVALYGPKASNGVVIITLKNSIPKVKK